MPQRGYRFIAPIEVALASYEMRPEPRVLAVRQLTPTGQVDPWGKVTDGTRIYFLVRDVIAGTRCTRRGTESGKETGVVVRGSRRRGRVLRRSEVTLGFSSATEYKLNSQTARAGSTAIDLAATGLAGRFRVRHTSWIAAQGKAAKH